MPDRIIFFFTQSVALYFALVCLSVYLILFVLALIGWVRQQRRQPPGERMPLRAGLLSVAAAPFRLSWLFIYSQILLRGVQAWKIMVVGVGALFMRSAAMRRVVAVSIEAVTSASDEAWRSHVQMEEIVITSRDTAHENTMNWLESLMRQFGTASLLQRAMGFAHWDPFGFAALLPRVLADFAMDQSRSTAERETAIQALAEIAISTRQDLKDRIQAVKALTQAGCAQELAQIARDTQRNGEVVTKATEGLETIGHARQANECWYFLLRHEDVEVRVTAGDKLKQHMQYSGAALTALIAIFSNESANGLARVRAAISMGEANRLNQDQIDTMVGWMREADQEIVRLEAAAGLAKLYRNPSAIRRLKAFCFEERVDDEIREKAIQHLAEIGLLEEVGYITKMTWLPESHRLRAADLLLANNQPAAAVRGWLAVAADEQAKPPARLEGLQKIHSAIAERRVLLAGIEWLEAGLMQLGGDQETNLQVRLEAARLLIRVGAVEAARANLINLAARTTPDASVRQQAAAELRRIA